MYPSFRTLILLPLFAVAALPADAWYPRGAAARLDAAAAVPVIGEAQTVFSGDGDTLRNNFV